MFLIWNGFYIIKDTMGHGSTRMHTDKYISYRLRRVKPYERQPPSYFSVFYRHQAVINYRC